MQAELELAELKDRNEDLHRDYDALLENLKWVHAIVSIMVELEGGSVVIPTEVLENYDLRGQVRVRKDEALSAYVIEAVPFEGDEVS